MEPQWYDGRKMISCTRRARNPFEKCEGHVSVRENLRLLIRLLSKNPVLIRLENILRYLWSSRFFVPILVFVVAPIFLGYGARTLTDFVHRTSRVSPTEQLYMLPRDKTHLPDCTAAIRAKYGGNYKYARYLERDGSGIFVFHILQQKRDENPWVYCDANSGTLLHEPTSNPK
jgi:hypothetical protein